jgi:hypothetical protein
MTRAAPQIREPLLSPKQLAAELGRSIRYVRAMVARGFIMPGGTATLSEARRWLVRNPPPCSEKWD